MRHSFSRVLSFGAIPLAFMVWTAHAHADAVWVKYRGLVDLTPFHCDWIERSTLVKRLCYDAKEQYVVVNLTGTYYHYCEVPAGIVNDWLAAESMGRFYNAIVKGRFDCRQNRVPSYSVAPGAPIWTVAGRADPSRSRLRRGISPRCEPGHWIDTVSDDGEIVILEDGSVWEIDADDSSTSAGWTSSDDIVACDDKLINTDEKETVSATRIR